MKEGGANEEWKRRQVLVLYLFYARTKQWVFIVRVTMTSTVSAQHPKYHQLKLHHLKKLSESGVSHDDSSEDKSANSDCDSKGNFVTNYFISSIKIYWVPTVLHFGHLHIHIFKTHICQCDWWGNMLKWHSLLNNEIYLLVNIHRALSSENKWLI